MGKLGPRIRFRMPPVRVNWSTLLSVRPRLAALGRRVKPRANGAKDTTEQHFLPGLEHLRDKMPGKRRGKGVR